MRTGQVNKELAKVVAKTVAGFLNAFGGNLLIGVSDDGEILGIEQDIATLTEKNLDSYELTLRNVLSNYLGSGVSPHVSVQFERIDSKTVAMVKCPRHSKPVYVNDGQLQFYVRDGNRTAPYDMRAAHDWIDNHFSYTRPSNSYPDLSVDLQSRITEMDLRIANLELSSGASASDENRTDFGSNPPWIKIGTRRVVDLYLSTLSKSRRWQKLFLVSPWISEFEHGVSLNFERFVDRIRSDRATIYVVTRPPEHEWHSRAIDLLCDTQRANVVFVKDLHAKIYTAQTQDHSFAMIGSANFTQKSLDNREIGVLINEYAEGKHLVSQVAREASELYRTPSRKQICKSKL